MANITGVTAGDSTNLFDDWWQFVLIAFILFSVAVGSVYLLFIVSSHFYRRWRKRRSSARTISSSVKKYISNAAQNLSNCRIEPVEVKPTSYGIYLGEFDYPPNETQIKLLAQWDLLIFDPLQHGIVKAMLSGEYRLPPQGLARLDVEFVAGDISKKPIVSVLEWLTNLMGACKVISNHQNVVTGILISNWEGHFTAPLLKEFIYLATSLGLSAYLEASAPKFLSDPKLAELSEVRGIVIRNGTISENGEERDAFQMAEMRPTIKAFVSQACLRSFVVLLWETLENDVTPLNAVVKRSYQWSRFYSALPWIGSKSALISADLSLDQREPLGAFDWLKELRVMKLHDKWRSNQTVAPNYLPQHADSINQLHQLLSTYADPSSEVVRSLNFTERSSISSASIVDTQSVNCWSSNTMRSIAPSESSTPGGTFNRTSVSLGSLSWLSLVDTKARHAISASPKGSSYDYLGCFSLGFDVTKKAFVDVVQSQRRFKEMKLLDEIQPPALHEIGKTLQSFCNAVVGQDAAHVFDWLEAIQELAQQLCTAAPERPNSVRAYIGLDQGFQIQPGFRFWGVYSLDDDLTLDIFLSRNAQDIAGAIVHTFLSSRGCPRYECFQAEMLFSEWSKSLDVHSSLPPRLRHDLSLLSPTELLKFLQRLNLSPATGDVSLISLIRTACEAQLLDSTDFTQLKEISTTGYLSGRASPHELINSRIWWYRQNRCQHSSETIALDNFRQVHITITRMLKERNIADLRRITDSLATVLDGDKIDSRVDLIAFSIFCAMRKHAFDEAYMEVTDRNTLFNDQSDQAAAFAELFATGARCEAYFDLTPSAFGKLLSDRYRAYHHKVGHEPPIWSDLDPTTPSAYAAAKIDVDPDSKKSSMAAHQRFTFLSVFAIPALLDIILLTTTGRGLYLSGRMSYDEQHSATLALMISLLISGAVGTWITCGGSYYLISMAFSAMNMFVLTRLVGGLAFTLAVATIGFAIVGATNGIIAGIIFFLYLVALTSYLCLLATLANFQYPGSAFQSGRPVIIMVVPFLFISPIITIWIDHDIYVYLSVLYVFLLLLVIGVRYTGSRWTTWYLNIEKLTDQRLREWYIETQEDGNEKALTGMTDPAVLKLARAAILREVTEARRRFRRKPHDPLVGSLAKSYDATVFLLEWYSGYSGTPLPMPYSSTWNMQTKVALQTLQQLQTGIRLHNAFIHWRQAGDEVGCSLLYFIVALLDKWSSLLDGGQLLGLSAQNLNYRMPVGFALAYYLIGAVLLDFNANKLHKMTAKGQNMLIGNLSSIPEAVRREVRARRNLYWTMLGRYLLFHVWSLAVASTLLWVFDGSRDSTTLFIGYVVAYTGLLWYQYTKIFTGPRSLKPLLVAVAIGLPLGQILRKKFPGFMYCDTVTLGTATWTAAFLSLYYARIKMKSIHKEGHSAASDHGYSKLAPGGVYNSFTNPGKDPLLSQDELRIIFHNLRAMRDEERYQIDPQTHPGLEIKSVLLHALGSLRDPRTALLKFALEAFPEAEELLELTTFAFERGTVIVDCVSMAAMTDAFPDVKAVSHFAEGHLRIVVGCEMMQQEQEQSKPFRGHCTNSTFSTAEILVHAVAETFMEMNNEDACLAESLLVSAPTTGQAQPSPVPSRVKDYLALSKSSSTRARDLARFLDGQTLKYLALQLDPETQWDRLPREIRELAIRRCVGQEEALTQIQNEWLIFNQAHGIQVKTFLTRCNYGAYIAMSSRKYALGARNEVSDEKLYHEDSLESLNFLRVKPPSSNSTTREFIRRSKVPFSFIYHNLGVCLKLLAIAFVAEPEFQRELSYALHSSNKVVRSVVMFIATGIWKYTKFIQDLVMPIFLFHGRKDISTLWSLIGGSTISLKRQRIAIDNTEGSSTAFIRAPYGRAGTFKVHQYAGKLDKEPESTGKLQRISTYNKAMLLLRREEYWNGVRGNVYTYEYPTERPITGRKRLSKVRNPRYPISRRCIEGKDQSEEVNFNFRGLIQSGSYILHGSLIRFSSHYRQGSDFEDELLRAEFVLPHLTCTVSWSAPPATHPEKLDKWIPHSQVTEATFVLEADVYESHWSYDHKFHPTIHTTLNGEPIETPSIIQWDHLGVLKKPSKSSFHHDDPLINFKSLSSHALPRWLGLNTHRNPVSTSRARSRLWNAWKNTPGFDGVMVRWLDEILLRKEPLLRPYWRRRDRGNLASAETFLNENADGIVATVDLDNSISGWAPLAMKIADLYSFGQGGDANSRTRSKDPDFDNDGLQVLAVDSGTWPNEGGGVSACRRDMINNLRSVNWHMIAESANDFGLPKHQTEMNVRSLKVIPLWGLDFLTPTHGLFKDRLDTEVEHVPRDATKMDVKRNFLPILTALVKGARSSNFTMADIQQTTRALVNLNTYFSESKHWGAIWTSDTVKDAWRSLWISQDLVSPTPSESWFRTEIPTVAQLDAALDLWYRYLFIFSIPIPDRVPAIFQSSHHSVSASYGIVCKIKRGCTLQIWDHAISWRETNLYLSSDLCAMAPFVRNALLGLMRITSQLILHHADTILPCADFFNPGWEVEIGSSQGRLEHRNTFRRKIDPVVNGIPDMTKFAPIKEIKSKLPTVTMLSHVWYAKDIKTAILAADIIVNEWGFTDYRLDIYGAIDKAPSYSTDCFEIIASKSLPRFVTMCGEANPTTVLEKTWVFLNSSISEGLPLALGEAALTGAPVVCTDVGASLRVLTDPDTGACYSAVVAPNDARNLARAQVNFLALLDEWAPYAEDPEGFVAPTIPDQPTADDVAKITQRMYEKTEQRRALGMRSREIVQKSFGGERYLREHEQMLWIGKARYDLLRAPKQKKPERRPANPELQIPSNVWGTASLGPNSAIERRAPASSVQTSSMMVSSLGATTLMSPGIRSLFDGAGSGAYRTSGSRASTLFAPSAVQQTPIKKVMPARVTVLARSGGYDSSEGSSQASLKMKPFVQDTFIRDITVALERV
ncbi:UDP-Glycosyltransferase phosphorylase [Venustampulla echinocandica]|uniref:UDP-Glycosyltransferase phosphorylase n=1 Tax=Venustampulla echinocandica TaxID=2656787 RepID=A0A370U2N8_9HELO|nr:UDP-Glycosyltransferase phosphorylase [Venustampulla echinocandica]RDL42046.1 UDP-Glycosyltransferase phosphorylase [Venustampulla echinocandica]